MSTVIKRQEKLLPRNLFLGSNNVPDCVALWLLSVHQNCGFILGVVKIKSFRRSLSTGCRKKNMGLAGSVLVCPAMNELQTINYKNENCNINSLVDRQWSFDVGNVGTDNPILQMH